MKAIMVMFDSLNRHMLPPYGCDWTHAPNFQRLADHSVTFDNCYVGSMPCMPARRELHTGRYNFLHRSWGPLEPFDESMPAILNGQGVYTHMVSDHGHYWEDGGATYHTRYNSWEIARGHEGDAWKGEIKDPEIPESLKKMRFDFWRQDWVNRQYMQNEEDHPQAVTFKNGLEFIQKNHTEDNWFLQIETFDPHEPFFSYEKYKELYPHDYDGPQFDWPDYARVKETPEQVEHARYEYAALLSMCDHYLGKVLDKMDELGLWEDTMLIVNTDHGFLLGEHDWWAKSIQPWYNEIAHTPLFIWDPRSKIQGEHCQSLVQTVDLAPTLLDFFGITPPKTMQGVALQNTIEKGETIREAALFGIHGGHVNVTDGRYVYMRAPVSPDNEPLFEYTLMPTHMRSMFGVQELQDIQLEEPFTFTKGCRTMKIASRPMVRPYQFGTLLFDLDADPNQEDTIINRDVETRMIELLVSVMQANDAPPEQYRRLGLPVDGQVEDKHLLLETQRDTALNAISGNTETTQHDGTLDLNTPMKILVANDAANAIIEQHFPGFTERPEYAMAKELSLKQIANFAPAIFSDEILKTVARKLSGIGTPQAENDINVEKAQDMDSDNRIEKLLEEMTLEEKASLLAGASMWLMEPVERLGIPAIKVTDGPNGARGDSFFGTGTSAACFPVGIAMAATWNTELIEQVGQALGEEAKSKGAHVLLAPTVNIHRSPLNGRNFECYSEDPYLTGEIATAYIKGVQSKNVGATIKHFVGNESEFERMTISSEIDERALREIYLPPFKAAVKNANVWAVMSAYNYLNGVHCSENEYILNEILREEWNFDGIVMSDWFSTRSSAESVNAGQDLEMPGPTQWRGDKIVQAVKDGEIDEATIDTRARAMLQLIERVGAFDKPEITEEKAIDNPEHRKLIRQTGSEAIVLLKNDGVLPLKESDTSKIAVIGPNAMTAQMMGGGSAQLKAHYSVTPYNGIIEQAGDKFEISYELGCTNYRSLPTMDGSHFKNGKITIEFYNNHDLSGDVIYNDASASVEHIWFPGMLPEGVNPEAFSAKISGKFTVAEDGTYLLGTSCSGKARLFVNDQMIADNWTQSALGSFILEMGSGEAQGEIELKAGQEYDLKIEYSNENGQLLLGVKAGFDTKPPADAIQRAANLAKEADVALVFVGLNGEWESEGHDRPDMELVGEQVKLIEQVAAVNPNTVVVLQTGSPITLHWIDKVAAVMQAWYPGQECGNAIADVLFGRVSPSGRLPQTFPEYLEDNPTFLHYPGENGKVNYSEGIFVGYRYYDKKNITPKFPFGFGLSYTTFSYDNLTLSAAELQPDEQLTVTVDVTNSGSYAGQEVVQLYVRDVISSLMRPEKELKAFTKVFIEPGETNQVTFTIDKQALAYYDDVQRAWTVEAGEFAILLGGSSRDIKCRAGFALTKTVQFDISKNRQALFTLDTPIGDLLDNERATAVLQRIAPELLESPQLQMAKGMSFKQVVPFAPDIFTEEFLQMIETGLAEIV
jgi:beta-glucosidase